MLADEPSRFGELLRRFRVASGLTQYALAERAGLSARGISDLERGARRLPRIDTVQRLSIALGLQDAQRAALLAAASSAGGLQGGSPPIDRCAPSLPRPLTSFVGRERELADIRRLLGQERLLTLTGTGGAGKTRLAIEAARPLSDVFPDGVWLVELAAVSDPRLVPRNVARALGVPEQSGRHLLDVLADAVWLRRLLLVLDNCERLVEACAALASRLVSTCPDLVILATSRTSLGVAGEVTWRVPSLSLPGPDVHDSVEELLQSDAGRLFLERAQAAKPEFAVTPQSARAVTEVCRRLDGVPLAIELAAARLRTMDPNQIVARLTDLLSLLSGGRTVPPRHQTLRATLDWSYDLLAEPERRLFDRLAVFSGGLTLEAAEAVCAGDGIEPASVLDLLTHLVDSSLVTVEPSGGPIRFRLLESVRQYAVQRLAACGDGDAVSERHAAFFIALAGKCEPETLGPEWNPRLDRLEPEHDNLRAALRWLIGRSDVARAQRLGGALALFWFLHGHREEGRRWLETLLAMPDTHAHSETRAKLLFGGGLIALHMGDYAAVAEPVTEALAIWRERREGAWVAYSLYVLGLLERWRGNGAAGRRYFAEGRTTARAASDRTVEAFNLRGLALVALDDGSFEEAHVLAEDALALARHPRSVSQAFTILGDVMYRIGDYAAARAYLETSISTARELGERILVRIALPTLAQVLVAQGESAQARVPLTESLALSRDHGDREGICRVLEGFACLAVATGRPADAVRLVAAAAAARQAIGAPLPPSERDALQRLLDPARDTLGDLASRLAWAEGCAMSPERAIACALSEDTDGRTHDDPRSAEAGSQGESRDRRRLTPRESEVAALVAAGLSNLQIAERLVISERTVESHVSNILGKLGTGSRARLAAWEVEHQRPSRPA